MILAPSGKAVEVIAVGLGVGTINQYQAHTISHIFFIAIVAPQNRPEAP